MLQPFVVIYTFIYNGSAYFDQLYKSVQKVKYSNFEWLIIDDGSTDNLEGIVAKAQKESNIKIRYYRKENQGKFLGYKYILPLIKQYTYAFCLDADDEIMPDAIQLGVDYFANLTNDYWCIDGRLINCNTGLLIGKPFPKNINELSKNKQLKIVSNLKVDLCGFQRVPALEELTFPNKIPENIHLAAELLLWGQLNYKYKQYYVNDFFLKYHYIENSNSHEKLNNIQLQRKLFLSTWQINNRKFYNNFLMNMIKYNVFCLLLNKNKIDKGFYKLNGLFNNSLRILFFIPSFFICLLFKLKKK